MKIQLKTARRSLKRFSKKISIVFLSSVLLLQTFLGYVPNQLSPVSAATKEDTTQSDFMNGKYEFNEIDTLTSQGDIKLQSNLGTWDASGPANLKHNVNTNTKVIKAGNFLYVFRNRQLGQFMRYDLSSREWKEMSYTPIQPYEVVDATTNGTDTIWAFATRSGRKHFLKYFIPTDTWSFLDTTPLALTQGSTLEYVPGSINYVYAFQGGGTAFWRYHIGNNSWSQLANSVATCTNYCALKYDGSQYLYLATDALSPDRFYRYDTINGGVWVAQGNFPIDGAMNYGSDLAYDGTSFYVMRSGGTTTFYKYTSGTWGTAKDVPFVTTYGSLAYDSSNNQIIALGGVGELAYYYPGNNTWSNPTQGPPANAYATGKNIVSDGNGNIYMCRGQNTTTCYKYTIATNTWSATMSAAPVALGTTNGTSLAYTSNGLFVSRGNSSANFYKYNPVPNNWTTTLANSTAILGDGSVMVGSGSGATGAIFALQGANSTNFYRYDVTLNTWSTKAVTPEAVSRGSGLVQAGMFTYLLNGGNRGKFFRYHETTNGWFELPSLPVGAYYGGGLTYDGGDSIYAMVGGENDVVGRRMYRYSILANTWTRVADAPGIMRYGGGITYDPTVNALFAYSGYGGGFWKYSTSSATFVQSGTWHSSVKDLIYASTLGTFEATEDKPTNTNITYFTRTSDNQNYWEDWRPATPGAAIISTPKRYIQVRALLTGNGTVSPTLSDYTINYTGDTTVPDVSGVSISAKSAKGSATVLSSPGTYLYPNPYFSWTSATDNQSGIDGYYVYFGSSDSGDPVTLGNFQQTTEYVVNTPMTAGTTYYLRIAPKNKAGTTPVAVTYFAYTYNGLSPSTTVTVASTQSEWDHATASKSGTYTAGTAWWNHAYAYRQQLTITSPNIATPGSMVRVTIDTDALESAGKLRNDRKDWRIVFWDGIKWQEVDRQYIDATTTYFPLIRGINASASDTNYYIYYGNPSETQSPRSTVSNSGAHAKWGAGSSFDGNDYIRIPTVINALSQMTIEGWFLYNNYASNRWLYGNQTTTQTAVGIASGNQYLTYSIRVGSSTYTNTGTTLLDAGKWHHFALTYDAATGTEKGYVNGRLDFTRSGLSGNVAVTTAQWLGASATEYYYGYLDEVRISNNVRYSASFTPSTDSFAADANTLSLYHFDAPGSQNVADSSGNNNNGTLGSLAGVDANDPQWTGLVSATSGSETNAPVSPADTSLSLEPLSDGSWAGYQVGSLPYRARMQYGASLYVNGSLYVLRGNNTVFFFKQNTTTGEWTQLADLPAASNYGSAMAWDGADSIYVVRGNASTNFYKYSISTDTWTSSIDQPIFNFSYGASIVRVGNMFYLTAGGNVATVLSFNKDYEGTGDGNDAWSTLQSAPYNAYYGAGLAYDGVDTLWFVAGNGSGFAKYSINTDTWDNTITAPALIPHSIGYASNNVLFRNNTLYTFTSYDYGSNTDSNHFIWKYDIAADMWRTVDNATAFWPYTGAVSYDGSRYAYLIQGYGNTAGGNTAVVRYDLETNQYTPETPPLPLDRNYANDGEAIVHQVYTGTSLEYDGADYIYMIQGSTNYMNRYQVSTKKWTIMPNIPCLYAGGMVYANNKLYAFCGGGTKKAYRFDPLSQEWTTLTDVMGPVNETITSAGSQIAEYDGADTIYVMRGAGQTTLYKYSISGNSWTTASNPLPGSVGNSWGASISYDGSTYMYVVRGNNTSDFYRLKLSDGTWTTLTNVPENVSNGSGSVYYNGKLFVSSSYPNKSLYMYDVATGVWQHAKDMQSLTGPGSALVKGPGNSMYALQGNYMFTFWKFNLPSSSSSYTYTGTYISRTVDMGKVYRFAGLSATVASPSATSVMFETRSSTDSAVWSDWIKASDLKKNPGNQFVYAINSPIAQYIQTRATLSSDESAESPVVSDISITYYEDAVGPSNPSVLNSYSSSAKTSTISASVWYNHSHPYFEWSGASDGSNGSGIAGYYVYFGTDSARLASMSGTFTDQANFTASLATDHSEDGYYYLNIQTVDNKGNFSSENWTAFVYRYIDTVSPDNPTAVTAYSDVTKTATISGSVWLNYPHPYFEWTGAVDDSGGSGIAGYYVYFGTDSARLASVSGTFQTTANYTATMQTDGSDAGDYYLLIQAKDTVGNIATSNWNAFHYSHIDTTAPTLPTTIVKRESSATTSAVLNEDTWYNGVSPYFEWTGAEDEATGSGILGYYVYFGKYATASASVQGVFQSGSSYTASLPTNGSLDGDLYFMVQTKDRAGNLSASQTTPFRYKYDHTAPTSIASENIAVLPNGYTAVNSFRFLWIATDEQYPNGSGSGFLGYYYKTGTTSGALSQDTFTTDLSVNGITAYQEGANTFYIRARDSVGNYTPYTTANFYWNKTAPSAPTNLVLAAGDATTNTFGFTWDEPATHSAEIKEYRYSINVLPNSSNISTTSANLVNGIKGTQDGVNTFYVVAVDTANNVSYGSYASITFNVSVTAPGIPLAPEIFDNSIRASGAYRIGLSWDPPTDKGSAFDRYEVYISDVDVDCSTDMTSYGDVAVSTKGESTQVAYIGTEKLASIPYYLCIKACATTNQCSGPSTTVSITPSGRWLTAPEMVGTQSATVKTKSAIIQWSTNRTSNSFVKYGTATGVYGSEVGSSNQVTAHEITLTELKPGTTYYYKMLWTDEDGNLGESDEKTFTTNSAPLISNVIPTRININSAEISFTIANAIKAKVEYGKTSNYDSQESITTSKSESTYVVQLTDLVEGTLYHYRIVGEDDEGNIYSGEDHIFETLPTPKILGLRVQQVIGMPTSTLRLLWSSNTMVSSIVTYFPTAFPERATDQISLSLKKNHEVIIKNLLDNTDYTILVKGKDSANNEAKTETRTLKTASDIRAPEVQNLNVESTIIGIGDSAKAQIVISWDTDEPATTQIEYAQGTGNTYNQTTQEDTNLTTNHIVTITALTPAKIYHLRANSKDKAGNLGQSFDTVVITPKSTKDALNLVIDNLSKTFGFLRGKSAVK